jgi:alpha-methylacyl-CoA racemase
VNSRATNESTAKGWGPLAGLRVVEFVSIGPGPHCAMLLADLGADVVRIDRPGGNGWPNPIADRGRHVMTVDLKEPMGTARCAAAAAKADVLLEGFRPGVMERLGLGPDLLLKTNPRLVYVRLTGWGQSGSLSQVAGHDINFIALTGALAAIGPAGGASVPPLNLVGDFGGGSLLAAFGIMAALWERERSGLGQVVDAAIVDGVASMMTMFAGLLPSGGLSLDKNHNVLGGAAPFYRCYVCADGAEIAVGALEPHFYEEFIRKTGAPEDFLLRQNDQANWRDRAEVLRKIFLTKSRAEWGEIFRGSDACLCPVMSLQESYTDPHLSERETYVDANGLRQAAPAPRFSRTPGQIRASGSGRDMLASWGVELEGKLHE